MGPRGVLGFPVRGLAGVEGLPAPGGVLAAFLGRHPSVQALLDTAIRLAAGDQPVLVLGETGTGKELIARLVHASSPRSGGPFRALNCASLPAGLLEAEVFGAARGAFTGAEESRPGILEAAHGGTLFLDEIGDMPPALQASLLRVLEDGVTRRLGETRERRVEFRVVAATHRDLGAMVAGGRFRADLLYRLGRGLRVPPLRERRSDIPLLARAFLEEAAGGRRPAVLDPGAERRLAVHRFPGNVRELRSILLSAVALAEGGVLRAADLGLGDDPRRPDPVTGVGEPGPGEAVEAAVRRLAPASVAAVAAATGIPRRTVQRRLGELVRRGILVRAGRGPAVRYGSP